MHITDIAQRGLADINGVAQLGAALSKNIGEQY
jgi:hypothetical protein